MIEALSHYQPFGLARSLWTKGQEVLSSRAGDWKASALKAAKFVLYFLALAPAALLDLLFLPFYPILRCALPKPPGSPPTTPPIDPRTNSSLQPIRNAIEPAPPHLPRVPTAGIEDSPPRTPHFEATPAPPLFALPNEEESRMALDRTPYAIRPEAHVLMRDAIQSALRLQNPEMQRDTNDLLHNYGTFAETDRDPDVEIFQWSAACTVLHFLILSSRDHDFEKPELLQPMMVNLPFRFNQLGLQEKGAVALSISMGRSIKHAPPHLKQIVTDILGSGSEIVQSKNFSGAYTILYPIVQNP